MKVLTKSGKEVDVYLSHFDFNSIGDDSRAHRAISILARNGLSTRMLSRTIKGLSACTICINGREYEGVSACYVEDYFNRHKGASIAVERALQQVLMDEDRRIELTKQDRADVWDRFFSGKYSKKAGAACSA